MEWAGQAAEIAGYVAFFGIIGLSLLSIILGLPGCWIILLAVIVFGLITDWEAGIAGWDILALFLMAAFGELLEFLVTAYGAKRYGASNLAVVGAIIGGIAGALLLTPVVPIIGSLFGAFLGVFLGAYLVTWFKEKDSDKALNAGLGAFFGRVGSVLVKGTIGIAMTAVIISQLFLAQP